MKSYLADETFRNINFFTNPLEGNIYENCIFEQCDFSNVDLSGMKFIECEFIECNLSLCKLINTTLRDVIFKDSKMLGLDFETCNKYGISLSFHDCILDNSSFYKTKIRKTIFTNTQLNEVDFSECDLTYSTFDNCDFRLAVFDRTVLEKADFRNSYNIILDPENNNIKKARFSLTSLPGLLAKYDLNIED